MVLPDDVGRPVGLRRDTGQVCVINAIAEMVDATSPGTADLPAIGGCIGLWTTGPVFRK
jgi:hypothetical protein